MNDDYCELCDLPRSTCIHGRPPEEPPARTVAPKARTSARPRSRTAAPKAPAAPPTRRVERRFTSPDALRPVILRVLDEAGGALSDDDFYLELEVAAEGLLLPGDHEKTPQGDLRWRYAARRARVALIDEGLMVKGRAGTWQLAR